MLWLFSMFSDVAEELPPSVYRCRFYIILKRIISPSLSLSLFLSLSFSLSFSLSLLLSLFRWLTRQPQVAWQPFAFNNSLSLVWDLTKLTKVMLPLMVIIVYLRLTNCSPYTNIDMFRHPVPCGERAFTRNVFPLTYSPHWESGIIYGTGKCSRLFD